MIPGLGRSTGEGIGYPPPYSWASLVAQLVMSLPAIGRREFDPWVRKICWRRERLPTPVFWPGEFHAVYSSWGPKELDCHLNVSKHLLAQNGYNDFLQAILFSELLTTIFLGDIY